MQNILYPTDFSGVSKKALNFIEGLLDPSLREVVILHVIDSRIIDNISQHDYTTAESAKEDYEKEANEQMAVVEEELKERGFTVSKRIEIGLPFKEIIRVADEEDVYLTVIGSHGRTNIADVLLGSVAEKVSRNAKQPVVIVKR